MTLIHLAHWQKQIWRKHYERKSNRAKINADGQKAGRHLSEVRFSGIDGVPDRIVLLPGGCMAFVEVKAPGEKPRPLQTSRHKLLRRLGFKVYVLDGPAQIGGILDEIHTP